MALLSTSAVVQIRNLAEHYRMKAQAAHAAGFGYVQRAQEQFIEEDDCMALALDLELAATRLEEGRDLRAEELDVRRPKP
jgi:hypothetical protein